MGGTHSVPVAFADVGIEQPNFRSSASPDASVEPSSDTSAAKSSPPSFQSAINADAKTSDEQSKDVSQPLSSSTSTDSQSWWNWLTTSRKNPDIPNPGTYDDINQEAMLILRPNLVEGLSFNFNTPLSETFAMGSGLEMGAKNHPGMFTFNANYYTDRVVMISRTSPSNGRILGRFLINHSPALTTKINADVGREPDSCRVTSDIDYRRATSSSQLKFASGRICALSHMHSVTPHLAFGGEALVQARTGFAVATLAAKYHDAKRISTISISSIGPLMASFVHKVNPKVSFATEMFVDCRTRESLVSVGYRFDLSSSTVVGHIDSNGKVAAVLEERINPALSLTLSGELDHSSDSHNFGFGVNIGGG